MTENEKRTTARFSIQQLVGLSADGTAFLSAKGLDLSLGGLSCETGEPLEPKTPVYLMLGLPYASGDHLIRCEGFVAHARRQDGKYVVGIEFTGMSGEHRSLLEEHLSALGSRS